MFYRIYYSDTANIIYNEFCKIACIYLLFENPSGQKKILPLIINVNFLFYKCYISF